MRKLISFAFALASFSATALPADRHIAFERNSAVYIANLDGTNEKKIADGIFPAISPDGTRVAFNTVEKTSDTTYARHMAVADVATGKVNAAFGSITTIFFFSAARLAKRTIQFYRMSADGKNLKRLIQNARFPSVSAPSAR